MCTYLDTFWCLFKDQLKVFLHYTLQKLTCYKLQFMTENCYIQYLQNKLYTCCVIILHYVPVHKIFTRYLFFNSMLSKEAPKHVEHRQYIFSLSILLLFTYFCFFFQYPQNEEIECLSWTQPKERWCHVAKWHNGSRECVCNGLSSYVLNLTATHSELKIPSIL